MENVYLIITDYHRMFKLGNNRFNYRDEIEHVDREIIDIAEKYKQRGCNVNFLFLGDIFHRQYKEPVNAVTDNNIIIYLSTVYGPCYSVLGNHEISFYNNNPFYTLFSTMKSDKIKMAHVSHVVQPTGTLQVLNVVDTLTDGNTVFHFNHYGCPDNQPVPNKVNIGLYHKEYVSREIIDDMERTYGNSNWITEYHSVDSEDIFRGYDYCFLGHMHKVYGSYRIKFDDTGESVVLTYLASLGRTNHTEVNNKFLERNIPAVIVRDGMFSGIESNLFNLQPREECVKEEVCSLEHEAYERVKESKQSLYYRPVSDNPIDNLRVACGDDGIKLTILEDLLEREVDRIGDSLMGQYRACAYNHHIHKF